MHVIVLFLLSVIFFIFLMKAAVKARAQVGTEWQKTNTDYLREKKKQGFYCRHSKKPKSQRTTQNCRNRGKQKSSTEKIARKEARGYHEWLKRSGSEVKSHPVF